MAETDKALDEQVTVNDPFGTPSNDEEYTQEETEEAQNAVNELENESGELIEDDSVADETATSETTEETKSYTNGIAGLIGGCAGFLKKFSLTSTFGTWMEKLADTIEGFYSGSDTNSLDATDRQGIVDAMQGVDAEDMVQSLGTTAAEISDSGTMSTQSETPAGEISQLIQESAQSNPKGTAAALQIFNDTAKDAINTAYGGVDSEEYQQAMANLGTINQTLTESFYSSMLEDEASGHRRIMEDTLQDIDTLDITGVNMSYSEYVPGADVSKYGTNESKEQHEDIVNEGYAKGHGLQAEDDPEQLRSSDGFESYMTHASESENTSLVGDTFDTVNMHDMGVEDVDAVLDEKNDYSNSVSASDSLSSMSSGALVENGLNDIHSLSGNTDDDINTKYHDSYVEIINGLTAYNDATVAEIESRYASDAKGKQTATDTLAETMRTNVEELFSSLKADNDALDFLTDEDKESLDNLKLTGVNAKFSDYQDGMNLKTGQIEIEDQETPGEISEEDKEMFEKAAPVDESYWSSEGTQLVDDTVFTNENAGTSKARQMHGEDDATKTLADRLSEAEAEEQAEQVAGMGYPG